MLQPRVSLCKYYSSINTAVALLPLRLAVGPTGTAFHSCVTVATCVVVCFAAVRTKTVYLPAGQDTWCVRSRVNRYGVCPLGPVLCPVMSFCVEDLRLPEIYKENVCKVLSTCFSLRGRLPH